MITQGQWKSLLYDINRIQMYHGKKTANLLFNGLTVTMINHNGGTMRTTTENGTGVVEHGHFGNHCAFAQPDHRASSLGDVERMFTFMRITSLKEEMNKFIPTCYTPPATGEL